MNTVLEAIVQIPAECLTNAKVLTSREDALLQVPRGGVAAEIGVALGYFSRKIMDTVKPEKFYAVDLFPDNLDAIWGTEFKEKRHFGWYRDTFSRDIESGVMEIKRGVSWEMIAEFPDDYFDYVYVDAAHDYVSVQKDVEALVPKVKHGGIIQFNDYIIFDYYKKGPYGVVPVVNKLVRNTHSEVLYYCLSTNCFDDIVIRLNKKAQND